MEAIKKIIKKKDYALYNIPSGFGDEAELTIKTRVISYKYDYYDSVELAKIQEQAGMMQMLNEPEEDVWNDL